MNKQTYIEHINKQTHKQTNKLKNIYKQTYIEHINKQTNKQTEEHIQTNLYRTYKQTNKLKNL